MHHILLGLALSILLSLVGSTRSLRAADVDSAKSPQKPNVIFILCDDLGWGDLGVFHQNQLKDHLRHRTPNLDKMAAEGLQLRAHYCPAPVCAPSRASLLTGVHQGHASVRDNQFDKLLEDNHTLATVMKQAGYATALVGKYGLQGNGSSSNDWPAYPTKRGFDEFFGYVRHGDGHVHYPANEWPLGNSAGHRSRKELWHNNDEISKQLDKCYTTDLFTARSKHWISQHVQANTTQPFFLYLAYDTPHAALQIPTVEYPAGHGLNAGLQWRGIGGKMINTAVGEIDSYRHPDYTGQGWSDVEERFATMVRRIDDGVGDLLQTLRDLKIDQNTVVIFSSDNGPHHESYLASSEYDPTSFQSYGHFDGTKRDTWEGGIRESTLAWGPGIVSGGRITDEPSQFHDWMPTFAELAGIAGPARTDGVSLVPTLTGQGKQSKSLIYIEYENNGKTQDYADFQPKKRGRKRGSMQVIQLDGYKGVRVDVKSHADPFEIYDLANDPKELVNLATSSSDFAKLGQRMKDRVLQLRMPNDSAKRPYDNEYVPAVQVDASQPGLKVETFAGDYPYVPNLRGVKPTKAMTISTLHDAMASSPSSGVMTLSGWIDVPADDEYTFYLSPSTAAFMRIHEASVIDADYGFNPGETRSGTIRLAKGRHPLLITLTAANNLSLGLQWSRSDEVRSDISDDAFTCR